VAHKPGRDRARKRGSGLLGVGEEWAELGVEAIPDMAKLGPAFKKDSGKVADAISGADASAMKEAIDATGSYDLEGILITDEMVSFERTVPTFAFASEFAHGIVYVDVSLTPEIEAEGYAAEVIRRIQDMRKELDLEVNDWIRVAVELSDERIAGLLQGMENFIAEEVRAKEISISDAAAAGDLVKDWTVESVEMRIGVGT
jgi:isoleucyl-tRNA synthetase